MQLIIPDADVVKWRPINNNFVYSNGKEWRYSRDYWTGILVQIGSYKPFKSELFTDLEPEKDRSTRKASDDFVDAFMSVELTDSDRQRKSSLRRDFGWINVVPDHPSIRSEPTEGWAKQGKEAVAEFARIWPSDSFMTRSAITCWLGPDGYEINVQEREDGGRRNSSLVITLRDQVRVFKNGERFDKGQWKESSLDALVVTATRPPGGAHGPIIDPPPTDP